MTKATSDDKVKVGITQGDINGIGYEVIIKTLMDSRIYDFCIPVIYGSPKIAAYHRKALNISNFTLNHITDISKIYPDRPNVINCTQDNVRVELGKSTEMAGKAAFDSLEKASEDLKNGEIDVLVTSPINKDNIQSKNFQFPGHTEYLANKFSEHKTSLMLMISDWLRIGVVAGHVPLANIPEFITQENIISKLEIMNQTLITDFAIEKPVIGVLGLNPHAGDNGLMGKEEESIIAPAIKNAREKNIMALGPYPADGFFGSKKISEFSAVLAMYHDQGLAPFKTVSFDEGVNYTAGLSVIRTSPAHGTAYEIAGQNIASPSSFIKALFIAIDAYRKRKQYTELKKNELKTDNQGAATDKNQQKDNQEESDNTNS